MRRALASVLITGLLGLPAGAWAAVQPLLAPPPDLAPLVSYVGAPIDKPPVDAPAPALPASPAELPPLPPEAVVVPVAPRPSAFLSPPGALPCVGAWLGLASKALECGRARFVSGEYEGAISALEQAARASEDRELAAEARYWLGETYDRLGRVEQADWLFRQVTQTAVRGSDWIVWSRHASGWTALRLRDAARARESFTDLLAAPAPATLGPWARHGLALAEYALGRWNEALGAWTDLVAAGVPSELTRDVAFWMGETLGRVGQHARAADELRRFVQSGNHPLLAAGWLRLGWWSLAAGRYDESTTAFRTYLTPATTPAADWAKAGLALALLHNDVDAARAAARELESRRSPLAMAVQVRFVRVLLAQGKTTEAHEVIQQLLAAPLSPEVRAWILLVNGDAFRGEGRPDEARTQYDLARNAGGAIGWVATLRLARTNHEMREFAQAVRDLAPVFAASVPSSVRLSALLLAGEAAYHAGDYAAAGATFGRILVEFPDRPEVAGARLGVAWSALREGRAEAAQRAFLDFAQNHTTDPYRPDALEMAAELTLKLGADAAGEAQRLFEQLISAYPSHPRTDFGRLNVAILMLRAGDARGASAALADWISRAPFPPLLGRAHVALGVARLEEGRPIEAARSFALARREGVGALAALGQGAAALAQKQLDAASTAFVEARDTGTAVVMTAAEYGLAAVAFQRGAMREFMKPALAALTAAPGAPGAPRLLYALTGAAVSERNLTAALGYARRLVDEFPGDEAADDALERVGAAAAIAKPPVWPIVYEAYTLLQQRYPASPFLAPARLALAQAQLETGRAPDARAGLERLVTTPAPGPEGARAWVALARARAATNDRAGALEAYERAAAAGLPLEPEPRLGYARMLVDDRRFTEARQQLEPLLRVGSSTDVANAAYGIADAWQVEGDHLAAVEYFLTAAYVAPQSPSGRRALLGAAWSFQALKQPEAAATVYRKLLAQTDLPPDLAARARKALQELGP